VRPQTDAARFARIRFILGEAGPEAFRNALRESTAAWKTLAQGPCHSITTVEKGVYFSNFGKKLQETDEFVNADFATSF
jgi:hypothetical protein